MEFALLDDIVDLEQNCTAYVDVSDIYRTCDQRQVSF